MPDSPSDKPLDNAKRNLPPIPKPGRKPYKRRLTRIADIRGALSETARALEKDLVDHNKANALCRIYLALADLIEKRDFERRLVVLEGRAKQPRDRKVSDAAREAREAGAKVAALFTPPP